MNRAKLRMLAISLASVTAVAGVSAYFTSSDSVTNTFAAAKLQIKLIEPKWRDDPTIVPEQVIEKNPQITNTDETAAYVFMQVTVPAATVTVEYPGDDAATPDTEKKGSVISSTETVYDSQGNSSTVTHTTHTVPLFRFVDKDGAYTTNQLSSAQTVNSGWYAMGGYPKTETDTNGKVTGYTYLYAWTGADDPTVKTMVALNPGETTAKALFDQVIFTNAREDKTLPGSVQNIHIEVFGIQTEYLKNTTQSTNDAEDVWKILCK